MGESMKDLVQSNENTNILITGGNGQIGSDLKSIKHKKNLKLLFPDSKTFNLLSKKTMVSLEEC